MKLKQQKYSNSLQKWAGHWRAFCADEEGATSIEYALIVGLIFLAIIAAVRDYTDSTSDMYSDIVSAIN